MQYLNFKKKISIILIVCLLLQICACSKIKQVTQNPKPKNFLSYDQERLYSKADLFPYSKETLDNEFVSYEADFKDFFTKNSQEKKIHLDSKDSNSAKLMIKFHNYSLLKDYINNYKQDIYNEYIKIPKSSYIPFINAAGTFKNVDYSKLEVNIDLKSIKDNGMYYTANCDFFERLSIKQSYIKSLKKTDYLGSNVTATTIANFPKKLTLEISEDGYTSKVNKKIELVAVSSTSFAYLTDKSYSLFNIFSINDDNETYDLHDIFGSTVNKYVDTKEVNILTGCAVAFGTNEAEIAYDSLNNNGGMIYTTFDKVYVPLIDPNASVVHEMYKDSVYANRVAYDAKGYITSLTTITETDNKLEAQKKDFKSRSRF